MRVLPRRGNWFQGSNFQDMWDFSRKAEEYFCGPTRNWRNRTSQKAFIHPFGRASIGTASMLFNPRIPLTPTVPKKRPIKERTHWNATALLGIFTAAAHLTQRAFVDPLGLYCVGGTGEVLCLPVFHHCLSNDASSFRRRDLGEDSSLVLPTRQIELAPAFPRPTKKVLSGGSPGKSQSHSLELR